MWSLNGSNKLRILHLFNHTMAAIGLYFYSPYWLLVSFLVWTAIGSFGISIGFHRLLSHKAFRTSRRLENLFATVGCLATGGSPIAWVGAHRMHHDFTDLQNDPHSWTHLGKWRVYFHMWGNVVIRRAYIKDLIQKPYLKFLHRHYFQILLGWMILLYLLHPALGIFLYSWPAVFAFHAFGLINLFGHLHGYRSYDTSDSSMNSWIANLLTCGEGWHNNHHKFPSLYRIGLRANEFDISALLLEKLPIMKDRQRLQKAVVAARSHSTYTVNSNFPVSKTI